MKWNILRFFSLFRIKNPQSLRDSPFHKGEQCFPKLSSFSKEAAHRAGEFYYGILNPSVLRTSPLKNGEHFLYKKGRGKLSSLQLFLKFSQTFLTLSHDSWNHFKSMFLIKILSILIKFPHIELKIRNSMIICPIFNFRK